jgi:hypothetical protein
MSDYSKSTNFTAKDTLPTGNAGKIIKGTEFDTEFTNIASAVSSKADVSSPSLLGSPTAPTATAGSNTTQLANTAYVKTAVDNFSATLSTVTGTWTISTTGNAGTVTNGVYLTGNQTIAGNKTFTGDITFDNAAASVTIKSPTIAQTLYTGGTTQANSMILGSGSINFYDSNTGNTYNSLYYSAGGGTPLAGQVYVLNYKTPSASSGTSAYQFYGDGTANKTGGGSWGSISDARLKDNVTPLTGALTKITTLNPVSYTWKIETTEPTVGFIAQEVQTVLPKAVTRHKPTEVESQFISDQTYTVGFQADMTAYLVAAIKELKVELDVANAKITALENA